MCAVKEWSIEFFVPLSPAPLVSEGYGGAAHGPFVVKFRVM